MRNTVGVGVSLPRDLYATGKRQADRKGEPFSAVVRRALAVYLDGNEERKEPTPEGTNR